MERSGRLRGSLVLAALAAVLLAGCVPRTLEVPPQFEGTPVLEDLRRELRRSRMFVRITTTPGSSGMVFPASADSAGENGERRDRISLVPERDRSGAVIDAVEWLMSSGLDQVLVAVRHDDELRAADPERVYDHPGVRVLEIESSGPDGDAAARRIVEATEGATDGTGVILLLGYDTPSVARALIRRGNNGDGVGPVVAEVLLSSSGSRLRRSGIPLAGAIVLDISGAIRVAKNRAEASNTIYVQSVFHRY